jgi:NAD(P)H-flavin reductase
MEQVPAAEPTSADAMVPARFRVADKRRETHDTWTLGLEPAGEPLALFSPGQFAMLYVFGVGEVPVSVSGELDRDHLVHTIRAVGTVTEPLCRLNPGHFVGVRGPFGNSWPIGAARGRDIVIVAGGIGLAPLRPVIYHVLAEREHYGRVVVAYGGRSAAELLYVDELEHWRGRFDVELQVTVDSAAGGWRGRVGVVTELIPRGEFEPGNAAAFVCGPEVMMRFTVAALRDAGVPGEFIHLSMERSMKCAIGHCGHCQLRENFICKDGPVFRSDVIEPLMRVREL